MNKKLLMLVLSFLIVCTQVVFPSAFVLADDANMAEYALRGREVLSAIGADQYINEDKNVTRLEFLSTLMAVMKLDAGSEGTSVFSDVPAASAPVINSALDMGIISEGKEFFPNNPIIYRDALKMSLMAAGYEYQCAIAGGYPYGVISVADQKDLMNSIDLSDTDALTLDSAYALLYNLFNINIVTQTGFGDSMSFSEMDGETILTRYHDVYIIEGIITGNSLTTLYAPRSESESFVEIDSAQYACDAKYEKLIGHNVVAFVKGKNAVSKTAIALFSERTETLNLNTDEVTKNGNILSVMEDANTKNYKLSSLYDVIYNGKSYSGNLTTAFLNSCESLTLISNDGDKSYDVVVLEDVTYTLIDNVNYIERKISTHATLGKSLDLSLSGIRYSISDANGNPLSIYQLQDGTLLSSIVSSDGLYVSITVCSETVAGAISEMDSQGNVTIDSVSYKLSDEFRAAFPNVGLGSRGLFYLDANGTVAMYEDRASFMAYGYIIASAPGAGIDPNHKVKILSDTGVVEICTFANKVVVDGEPKSGQDAYAKVKAIIDGTDTKLIKYSLNNENEITRIDTPSLSDADDGCVQTDGLAYNNNLTMYDFTNDSSFSSFSYRVYGTMLWPKASLASAKVFVVPDHTDSVGINDVGNEKKYRVGSADACLSHEQSLSKNKVKIFNMDKYGGCEVIVYHQPPSEGVNFKTTSYSSAVLVNITNAIVNDEESRKLTVLMNGTFSEYVIDTDMVDEATLKDSGKALCPGDIIRFKADNGVISDLVVDFDADPNVMAKNQDDRTSISFNSSGATNIQYQSGKLYSISSSNALLTPDVGGRIDKRAYNYSFATLRNHDIPSSTMVKVSLSYKVNDTSLSLTDSKVSVADFSEFDTYLDVGEKADYAVIRQNALQARLLVVYELIAE